MSFSQEDKNAWANSEVMKEFEKVASESDILNDYNLESFSPLQEDEEWEEDVASEETLGEAVDEFIGRKELDNTIDNFIQKEELKESMASLYMNNLLSNLQDLAHDLAEQGHIKVARKIEVTINIIKGGAKQC
jgi:hypothetical protein